MRKLEFYCDRCGCQFDPAEGGSAMYRVPDGLEKKRTLIDLCEPCESALRRWLSIEADDGLACGLPDFEPEPET